jgi:2-polyprenyl-3-methyl-5-hydroxy-6-metoxy-1,4-benzoquinol methylase
MTQFTIQNKNQINYVVSNPIMKKKFRILLVKFFRDIINVNKIISEAFNSSNDKEFYDNIRKYYQRDETDIEKINIGRANKRADRINKILISSQVNTKSIVNYLDIGADDCRITEAIGKVLSLDKNNVYGIDIKGWIEHDNKEDNYGMGDYKRDQLKCNFKYYDGINIPHAENTFDFVTLLQVMHHVPKENLKKLLQNVVNVMKDQSYLFIREHDSDPLTSPIIDIEHALWELVVLKEPNLSFYESYYSNYQPATFWDTTLQEFGFKKLSDKFDTRKYNVTKYFSAVYVLNKNIETNKNNAAK